jgi:adenylate kinase
MAMKSTIVLLGPPGSGKGTQGEKLSDELGYIRLSTGDMLREAVRNQTELGMKAKEFMDAGALVPNDLIIGLMKEKIAQAEGGVILDGFPRTVEQANALAEQLDVDLALNLDVDDEELISRLTKRRSCPQCNAVYHLVSKPPMKEGICDKCGSELYQRDDDTEATVSNRLKVYRENTMPLIDYYADKGTLVTIKGIGSIDEIFAKVKETVQ